MNTIDFSKDKFGFLKTYLDNLTDGTFLTINEYEYTYNRLLNEFITKYTHVDEIDFVLSERNRFISAKESIINKKQKCENEISFLKKQLENFHFGRFKKPNNYILIDGELFDEEAIKQLITNKISEQESKVIKTNNLIRKIDFLETRKKELYDNKIENQKNLNKNPFPKIFDCLDDRAFNLFNDFAKEIVTDYYLDYSFIFQKMKNSTENLIDINCKHKYFMDWLFTQKYITQSVYDDFKNKESFSTKAERGNRPTRYYAIKERYFPIVTD